jgi:hypothetical protein
MLLSRNLIGWFQLIQTLQFQLIQTLQFQLIQTLQFQLIQTLQFQLNNPTASGRSLLQ